MPSIWQIAKICLEKIFHHAGLSRNFTDSNLGYKDRQTKFSQFKWQKVFDQHYIGDF